MRKLLVLSHTPSANTETLLRAFMEAANEAETDALSITQKHFLEAQPEDLNACHGVVFLCTENIGYMSGLAKDWFDRHFYYAEQHCQGMPYSLVVRAGLDGTATCKAVASICQGMGWNEALPPLLLKGEWQDDFIEQCKQRGQHMALAVDMGLF